MPADLDPTATVATFWAQWLEQSTRGTQALLEAMQNVSDPGHQQKLVLDALAQSLESFMRTPVFLEQIQRNLKMITDLKMAQDQIVQGTASQLGIPLADDIRGLFERLHSTEQTILDRLQVIEERLRSIEAKVT